MVNNFSRNRKMIPFENIQYYLSWSYLPSHLHSHLYLSGHLPSHQQSYLPRINVQKTIPVSAWSPNLQPIDLRR